MSTSVFNMYEPGFIFPSRIYVITGRGQGGVKMDTKGTEVNISRPGVKRKVPWNQIKLFE